MSRAIGRTRATGATGENLVSIALREHMDWIPRKDEFDEGIDLNVEVPADPPRPGRRFLAQVKTRTQFRQRTDGSWTVTIRGAVARRYRSLREPVFLLAVDLQRNEIRWTNVTAALKFRPNERTFGLNPQHVLKPETASKLRSAVFDAFDESDDQYHPPLEALRHRERKLEGLNPSFTVKGAIVDGVERYEFGLRQGGSHKVRLKTRTEEATNMLQEAHDFGSRVELAVKREDIAGLPILPHPTISESLLKIEARSKRFRLGLTSTSLEDAPSLTLELDAELARGTVGWEVRTADPACPFEFRVMIPDPGLEGRFEFRCDDHPWEDRPLAELPGLKSLQRLTSMLSRSATLTFDWIDTCERRTMTSFVVHPESTEHLKGTMQRIEFFCQLAELCRSLGFESVYHTGDVLTENQFQNLALAFSLLPGKPIPFSGYRYSLRPNEEGRRGLHASAPVSLTLKMTLELSHGKTRLGSMPVRSDIRKFTALDNPDGTMMLEATEADLAWDREESTRGR
jgi:hypothetical protein